MRQLSFNWALLKTSQVSLGASSDQVFSTGLETRQVPRNVLETRMSWAPRIRLELGPSAKTWAGTWAGSQDMGWNLG